MKRKYCAILIILSSITFVIASSNYDEDNLIPDDYSPCLRECKINEPSQKCYYKFVVEWYQTLSRACYNCPKNTTDCLRPHCVAADGTNKAILVVNRKMPGPGIQVCAGDEIIIDVENHLPNDETTIHWHGHHQRKTPFMDGVPYLTQCPIPSESTFRYQFNAEHIGTNFWHSHSGNQRGDGIYGPMITRVPKEFDHHGALYDYDSASHVIVVTDFVQDTSQSIFSNSFHSDGKIAIKSLLVNGLGYFIDTETKVGVPPARFTVKKNYRYRFRLINAEFLVCPIEVSVDNHTITVISTDSFDIQPIEVQSFVSYAGERFDFVINANQNISNYWIRFRGLLSCSSQRTHQVAVLSYEGAVKDGLPEGVPTYETAHKDGLQLNSIADEIMKNTSISIPQLNATQNDDIILKEKADYKFFIHYDFYNVPNKNFYAPGLYDFNAEHSKFQMKTPQLNHITFKFPSFPLLTQPQMITKDTICNETTVKNCTVEFCQCTHVLQVPLNAVVEIVLTDMGSQNQNHPFHLHGHSFRVLGMERLNSTVNVDTIKDMDRKGLLKRKLHNAPLKDTITVPKNGYTIIRFYSDNPGYWLFHCHIDFHASLGMALIFQVGEHEDIVEIPKDFPRCGDWIPSKY